MAFAESVVKDCVLDIARYEIAMPPEAVVEAFTKRLGPVVDPTIAEIHKSRT